ncbi:HET-domain-containing protein [Zopfia rhizophila CBS 207.26]|uniref:HET-domain-containing protein n=1 Tax=Zopfia rhizophila CBS 207.26 TaxID=1314779 RepID=A0A6A6EFN4_9PEZI|nr:HET-domain-containing protein [Zopfia rhizophila CBS 207.26]
MSHILSTLGIQKQIMQVSFTVFPTKVVQCLRATVDKGTALYLQPTEAKRYLKEFDRTYLSTGFSKKSLQHCINGHAQTCSMSQDIPNTKDIVPIYLIDLHANCLVRASTREKYAALSYVWGSSDPNLQHNTWECSKTALSRMLELGFFTWNFDRIPQSVEQAMTFTRNMGLKYLWVDRYCVPQDDQPEKHSQLQAMGSIYYHAHFVIIAAGGDGSHGLCTEDCIRPKYRTHCRELLAEIGVVYEPATENTRWSTRGWTFQERIFARRSFVFRGDTVTFQCQKSIWQEGTDIPISHDVSLPGSGTTKLIIHKWPNMFYFKSLVEEYVERELTYPCDSLDAFAGVLDALEASFLNGFLFGLPEVCFDIGLLWQPKGVLADRISLAIADSKPLADLPSWSWARWKGPFDFSAWEAAAESLFLSYYNQSFYTITTIVKWQKTSRSSGALVPLVNCYSVHRALAQDSSLPPPVGWKRQALRFGFGKDGTLSRLLRSTNHQFTHSALGEHRQFRFPVPLPLDIAEVSDNQSWTSKIQGVVKRAFLSIKPKGTPRKEDDRWYAIERKPTSNRELQVGLVQLHDPKSEDWSTADVSGEFIAISAGEFLCVPGQSVGVPWTMLDEWEMKRRSKDGNVYEFYNVMLIEGHGGIAMRKGLGRVQKTMWESLDLEEVEVVLA